MHQRITVKKTTTKGWKTRMNRDKTVKAIVALLAIFIVSTINVGATQTSLPLKIEANTLASVSPANVLWEKTCGGAADDRAFYALAIDDGYLVVGSSKSIVVNTTVGWVLRLNGNGDVVWNKTFLEGWGTELRYAVNITDGYLLVGNEFFESGQVSGYVVRIDNHGDLQWMKNLTQGATGKLFSGIATIDGFVVFGLSSQRIGEESSVWAVKLDVRGNVVWSRTYGGSVDSAARSGVLTQEGDYLMAGYTDSKGDGNYDFYLLDINSSGDIVWNNTYGGEGSQKAYSITKANGGYVVVGDIQILKSETDAWVLKVDLAGNVLWNRSVGGKDADSAACAKTSRDGGYLVAGFTFSFGAGNRDFWLFKISDSGEVFWSCTQGDKGYQEAYAVIEADNAYVMVGWTDPIGNPALIGKAAYDFSIVKLGVSQNSIGLSNFQLAIYVAVAIAVSFVILVLLIIRRGKGKNSIKS
jgi:hypothetical protein